MPLNVAWPDAKLLISEQAVLQAITAQAQQINEDLADTPVVVLCVLQGGLVYTGHLLTQLRMPTDLDCLRVTRYRNTTTGAADLQWLVTPSASLAGKTVLLLDDIFDEGKTLEELVRWAEGEGASRVYSAVMLDKQHQRKPEQFRPDSAALEVPDAYVFGMGMDYKGAWRNASGVWALCD